MIRLVHAADLHLDSPFELLGERAEQRRAEQRETLERIAELCRTRCADILLLAGDLFDSGAAYAETLRSLAAALGGLEIPVLISPGNHDFCAPASPYMRAKWSQNVTVFTRPAMECVALGALGVRVWGAGYADISCPPLLRGFSVPKEQGIIDIGLLHAQVGMPVSPYCPVSEDDIAASGLDYLALGHVHTYSGLRRAGGTFYAWPGCPEGRGFDECGDKGVIYAELDAGECRAEQVTVCRRRYEKICVPCGDGWESSLPEGTQEDIYRIILTGERAEAPNLQALREMLEPRFFALELIDATVPARDVWDGAEQDSLRGLFLRKMRARLDAAADDAERESIVRAVRWGLAALDNGEAVERL
ncbi:MAG: DNA repair exonuclease [Oscillospiraceae bacterium]|nr:DNA repair exonuclease [Oscillospiraceae bacterium]